MQDKTKWDKDLKTITFSWDKGCNYLNFRAVVYVDAKHRKTALIDGGVCRAFDSYRYEISSCASARKRTALTSGITAWRMSQTRS